MSKALNVLCLGSAACKDADLKAAAALGIRPGPWTLVAVNHAAMLYPGPVDHWATFHCELMPRWITERKACGLPDVDSYWTAERRPAPAGISWSRAPNWGGSSGLLAVSVALMLGAHKVVCCGIPLDVDQAHFDDPAGKPWREGGGYRRGWSEHKHEMGRVRSMSGWTADLLGRPDADWLAQP